MNLEEYIKFFSFTSSEEELAKYYAMSDALLLLSHEEPWGMVVNEASIFDLKLILSRNIGAGYDFNNKIFYEQENVVDIHNYILDDISNKSNDKKNIDDSAQKFLL